MIAVSEALVGSGPIRSSDYCEKAAKYHEILDECRAFRWIKIVSNHSPDVKILTPTCLHNMLYELKSVVSRLESILECGI